MRFLTVVLDGITTTVAAGDGTYFYVVEPGRAVDESLRSGVLRAFASGGRPALSKLPTVPASSIERVSALVRSPKKLWGIGLNYVDHAGDLGEQAPTEPASFLKGTHTLIGADDSIILPEGETGTTAEAELGIVIGRTAYNVDRGRWREYVAGVCLILDQTAETILRRNPRFLTRAKNYPSFLSIGPELITLDEALAPFDDDIRNITVETRLNGHLIRANKVANMMFPPDELIAFHSRVMPLYPGDVISTGTPGAVPLRPGDLAECRIPLLGDLTNPVVSVDDPTAQKQLGELFV